MTNTAFISLLLLVNSGCVLADRAILLNEKERLKKRLEHLAVSLKGLSAVNAPQAVLRGFDSLFRFAFGPRYWFSWRLWLSISALSLFFTTQAYSISQVLERDWPDPLATIRLFHGHLGSLVSINLALDVLVWAVFLLALHSGGLVASPLRALRFAGISAFCLLLVAEKRYGVFYSFIHGWHLKNFYLTQVLFDASNYPYVGVQMFGAFFPFLLFLLLCILAVLSIPFIAFSLWLSRRLVATMAEQPADKLAIFTLVGSFASFLSAVIKFSVDYAKGA